MKKRELKRSIIRMLRTGERYGYELRKLLAAEGDTVQLSYLYKTLKEMADEGLLESRIQKSERGPKTRRYRLTAKGRRELAKVFEQATELIHDFYEDYVSKLPPEFFGERFRRMMEEVYGGCPSVALVVSQPLTHVHHEFLEGICARRGAKRTYLVKPPHVKVSADLPNLTVLDGEFEDIPLKDESLDAMVVVDIQDADNLRRSCKEFRRVLRAGGIVCGCAPFMGLGGATDPLDVGEFMKRMRYDLVGRPYLDKEKIRQTLGESFDYVDVASLGFLTAFLSGTRPIRV